MNVKSIFDSDKIVLRKWFVHWFKRYYIWQWVNYNFSQDWSRCDTIFLTGMSYFKLKKYLSRKWKDFTEEVESDSSISISKKMYYDKV